MRIFNLKNILMFLNILLVFFLMLLNNFGVIPLQTGDFIFFALIALAFALYRPGWAFLFFIGTIMLENVNLAPGSIAIRPYQIIGALTVLAILIRLLVKRLNFSLDSWKWHDGLIILINISGFLSLINAPDKLASLKLTVILASFSVLYYLTRIYIKNISDLKKVIPFFLGASAIIALYGIWQNIAYLGGRNGFEIMPGRPNATFTEPDWLGGFVILAISVLYGVIYYYLNTNSEAADVQFPNPDFQNTKYQIRDTRYFSLFLHIILTAFYLLLILTVSRSAWLGMSAATFIFLFFILTGLRFRNWRWKLFFKNLASIASAGIISLSVVLIFHLTNFQLFNRVQSTGTGLQKITVSCENRVDLPENITDTNELSQYGCRHINLEEIRIEESAGKYVAEIYRNDPNVSIRAQIYQKSWQEIKKHPILGIGWGTIGEILGRDERGMALNSSNIFLEVWLGTGFAGILSFVVILIYALGKAVVSCCRAQSAEQKAVSIFIISSWFGLIIFNLFNAGIFLGFLWVWLAVNQLKLSNENRN